jgi:hypothetical protein
MKIKTADGYQDGKAFRVTLSHVEQYADTLYQSDELAVKVKLVFTGKHGALNRIYTIPMVEGSPVLRPNMGLARALAALGHTWDAVKVGLELTPISKAHRTAYGGAADWVLMPSLKDSGQAGFVPVRVDLTIGGASVLGSEVIATVVLTKDGLARIDDLTPLPEADDDDAPEPALGGDDDDATPEPALRGDADD